MPAGTPIAELSVPPAPNSEPPRQTFQLPDGITDCWLSTSPIPPPAPLPKGPEPGGQCVVVQEAAFDPQLGRKLFTGRSGHDEAKGRFVEAPITIRATPAMSSLGNHRWADTAADGRRPSPPREELPICLFQRFNSFVSVSISTTSRSAGRGDPAEIFEAVEHGTLTTRLNSGSNSMEQGGRVTVPGDVGPLNFVPEGGDSLLPSPQCLYQ